MISQLASSGKVRKIFAHCLDTIKGGGIFAIGNVVQPKVKMTPLVPKMYVTLQRLCFTEGKVSVLCFTNSILFNLFYTIDKLTYKPFYSKLCQFT